MPIQSEGDLAGPEVAAAATPRLTVVVPVRDGGAPFGRCLDALAAVAAPRFELLVVDDGSVDGSGELAASRGVRVLRLPEPAGPAAARNLGAREACGEILFFVDADCELHADALALALADFDADPALDALFGSYDDAPASPGLVSQFKNLFHHWVHQRASGQARTFWAGCGAVRRERFLALGGFDAERYREPSIEDIELGYRISESGGRILLDKRIQARHLKRWTLAGWVRTDVMRRGAPWTELLIERRDRGDQLNVGASERLVVLAGALAAAALPVALLVPQLLALTAAGASTLLVAHRGFYALVRRRRGFASALAVLPLHALYCCSCCVAAAIGAWRAARAPRKRVLQGV